MKPTTASFCRQRPGKVPYFWCRKHWIGDCGWTTLTLVCCLVVILKTITCRCPRLETSACQMEAFRAIGLAGDEARCNSLSQNNKTCSTLEEDFSFQTTVCANQDDLPSNILANTDHAGHSFVERACCTPDAENYFSTTAGSSPSTTAPFSVIEQENDEVDVCVTRSLAKGDSSDPNLAAIVGGSVAGTVFLVLLVGGFVMMRRRRRRDLSSGDRSHKQQTTPPIHRNGQEWNPPPADTVAQEVPEEAGPVPPMAVSTILGDPIPAPTAPEKDVSC